MLPHTIRENHVPATNFPLVFEKLKSIFKPYRKNLTVTADTATANPLDGPYSARYKKVIFFGSALIKKTYVAFYLMPMYMFPELLDNISPELKQHMQGKSCFNFKKVEPELFKELKELTRLSFELARQAKTQGEI